MNLSPVQSALLAEVRRANEARREAQASAEHRIREEVTARVSAEVEKYRRAEVIAAYQASAGGVPARQIGGPDGLRNSDPRTIRATIDAGRELAGVLSEPEAVKEARDAEPLFVNRDGAVVADNNPFTWQDGRAYLTANGSTVEFGFRPGVPDYADVLTDADYQNPAAHALSLVPALQAAAVEFLTRRA